MIQLDDEQYWLYAAVDPESNDLLHTKLEPTRTNVIADQFFAELREKHGLDFRYELHGNRNSVERVFCEVKRRTVCFSNCFSNSEVETADEWLRSFAFAWNQLI